MADAVDEGIFCKTVLEEVFGLETGSMPMTVVTDSLSLEKTMNGTGVMKDK